MCSRALIPALAVVLILSSTCLKAIVMKDITDKEGIAEWSSGRSWSISGNKVIAEEWGSNSNNSRSLATRVVFPTSIEELASIISSLPQLPSTSISSVCGGHSSSNVATFAGPDAVVFDMRNMNSITVDQEKFEITVGGGTLIRDLAEAVAEAGGSLPIGTGDTVGVAGFVLNGGLSGYFSRRLGLLGQRVTRLTMVTADGTIRELSKSNANSSRKDKVAKPEDEHELFQSMLGAGSALGIVTSLTFSMEKGSAIRTGGQLVVLCGNLEGAKAFARSALGFIQDTVLPDAEASVSMELVVTAEYTAICTLVFFDSFEGDPQSYIEPLRAATKAMNLEVVLDDVTQWKTWFQVASSLWPVIAGMKGDPLVRLDHCMGTRDAPTDATLDFVVTDWLGGLPFVEAPLSIMEARTLGGAVLTMSSLPSGNAGCTFFVDMIVAYDAGGKSLEQRKYISQKTQDIVALARKQGTFEVDFSGTHSQVDTRDKELILRGQEIFGSQENFKSVMAVKQHIDPFNRFRFHPFGAVLGVNKGDQDSIKDGSGKNKGKTGKVSKNDGKEGNDGDGKDSEKDQGKGSEKDQGKGSDKNLRKGRKGSGKDGTKGKGKESAKDNDKKIG
eukprot:g46271.t1